MIFFKIIQTYVYIYFILIFSVILLSHLFEEFYRFFFFSEIVWLLLFTLLLLVEFNINSISLLTTSFLILVFTALELVMFTCITLLKYKKS